MLAKLICSSALVLGLALPVAAQVSTSIADQGDTTHLEFSGLNEWKYDLNKVTKNGKSFVEMTIDPLDVNSVKNLTKFSSPLVKSVVIENGSDSKTLVRFELTDPGIDIFDYLTDQPSRLIVDFFRQSPAPQVAEKSTARPVVAPKAKKNEAQVAQKEEVRKPASADALQISKDGPVVAGADEVESGSMKFGVFDGGDPSFERFSIKDYELNEESVLRSKENYYIAFPMLEQPFVYWNKIKAAPTVYAIDPKNSEENKQARLLLTLFEKGRHAVFQKAVGWFKEKFPQSEYNEIIDYMAADVHFREWEKTGKASEYDKAIQAYKDAIKKYPDSSLAERTSLRVGFLAIERGDYLNALRYFEEHLNNPKFVGNKNLSKDIARLGTAMAYMNLRRYAEALGQFAELEKTSQHSELRIEAAFRKGDVYIKQKAYQQAINEYRAAIEKYPKESLSYPSAYYNRAESLFGEENFRPSLDVYRDFLTKFPDNQYAPFAMTRIGELLEILGADKSRVVGAYLETFFRYCDSPSAIIARLRLASTRMKGMKPKEVEHTTQEIMALSKKMKLPNIEQFANIMIADGYRSRGENQKAIDLLTKYYQSNPTAQDLDQVSKRVVLNINDKIKDELDKNKFIEALQTYSKYNDNWLKKNKRLDTQFFVGQAYEMAGVPVEAEKNYRQVLNKALALKGTQDAKELEAINAIPDVNELRLRLAKAHAMQAQYNQAYDQLRLVKNPEKLSEKDQVERVELAVDLLEKKGDVESAVRYLTELLKTWKGQPELVAKPYMRLADFELAQGKTADAINSLKKIDEMMTDSSPVEPSVHAKSLEKLGEIFSQQKNQPQTIATYQKLLDKYEEKFPLSSIRYRLGDIYFKRGEVQKAADVWTGFKGPGTDLWQKLAQEQLKNSSWRDEYKKYIQRIPAMAEGK